MKTQILNSILAVVSDVCEIPADTIRSHSKNNEVVDARCIFVYYAFRRYGFKAVALAHFLDRKRICSINDCLRNHNIYNEQSVSYRLMCAEVGRKLSQSLPISQR